MRSFPPQLFFDRVVNEFSESYSLLGRHDFDFFQPVDIDTCLRQLASQLMERNTKYIYLSRQIDVYIADLARVAARLLFGICICLRVCV